HHVIGGLKRRKGDIEAGKDREVPWRSEVEYALVEPALDDAAGDVAGRRYRVIGVVRHAELVENPLHGGARPRRIADQDHGAAAGAKALERLAGRGESRDTVMNHAPNVAQQHVIAARERCKPFDDSGQDAWRHQRVEWPYKLIGGSVASAAGVNKLGETAAWRASSGVAGNALQRIRAHRAWRRKQKSLPEADIVIQEIDHD